MTTRRNPFIQSGALALNNPLFRGRVAELAQLERACLHEHQAFMLVYGGRQNGKTSLLLRLEARLREQLANGVRVCRVDFQDIPSGTTQAAFQHLITELRRNLPQAPQSTANADSLGLRDFLEQALTGTELRRIYRAVANGTLEPSIGTKLTYIAREVGQFVVLRELAERLECLEHGRAYLRPDQRAALIEGEATEEAQQ